MRKYILLLLACICFSVPAFAQRGNVLKLVIQPVKVPPAVMLKQVTRSLARGKFPSASAIKMAYLQEMNIEIPNVMELQSGLRKSGAFVRQVPLPGSGISHVLTFDGKNWFVSPELVEIINRGFFVQKFSDGRIGFSIDRESPAFDFFDYNLLLEMKSLKEAGFLFKSDGDDMFGIAFPQTAVSETPIYVINKMGRLESGDPVPMKYLSGPLVVPQKTFTTEEGIWCYYPTKASPMVSADGLSQAMKAYHSMYDQLNVVLEKLGSYKNSVDIVWRADKYVWTVRTADGRIYDSVNEFFAEKNIHP